jgi:hypothetical protein
LVASEKIKPYNNSFYQLAMKQQYGSKLGISVKNQKAQTEFLQTSNDQNYTCSIQ